jgi:stearoyl-CoA desaturase (delta-9 desaturase)
VCADRRTRAWYPAAVTAPARSAVRSGPAAESDLDRLELSACIPLLSVQAGCLLVLWTGASPVALAVCAGTYLVRAFGVAAGYHRLLSHRAFETSRPFGWVLAFLGCAAGQLGPLWWAAHHRRHHLHSDHEGDPHSPVGRGMWWAHMRWLLCRRFSHSDLSNLADATGRPELRLLDRLHWVAPATFALGCYGLGVWLAARAPGLGTDGLQMLAWGFFVSTTLLYHATFAVNSLAHTFGGRRFDIPDRSRNNAFVSLLTLGEGWQNNHHAHPACATTSFSRWELDPTYRVLRGLEAVGLVWNLRAKPSPQAQSAISPHPTPNESPSLP